MATIYDIAKITGYSAPTVSKALNNLSDISEATKQEILNVAKQLNYVPNQHAKSLVTKKSWLIGIIYEEWDLNIGLEHPLFSGIMSSFKRRIEEEGYELLFLAKNLGKKTMTYLDHCKYRAIDGLMILNHNTEDQEIMEVINSTYPSISSNIVYPGTTTVTSENTLASMEAVEYLYQRGHRLIGHISGPIHTAASAGLERFNGYQGGLKKCGLTMDPRLVAHAGQWNHHEGYLAMKRILDAPVRPTAVYCGGDILYLGALKACKEYNISIPGDISFVGFDDNDVVKYLDPPLTTFYQDRQGIGRTSAELLLEKIQGGLIADRVYIPTQFYERKSVRTLG